jgi:hypothetical protein
VKRYEKIWKKSKLKSERYGKYETWKNRKLSSDKIWRAWKKPKLNSEKIWKIRKKIVK